VAEPSPYIGTHVFWKVGAWKMLNKLQGQLSVAHCAIRLESQLELAWLKSYPHHLNFHCAFGHKKLRMTRAFWTKPLLCQSRYFMHM